VCPGCDERIWEARRRSTSATIAEYEAVGKEVRARVLAALDRWSDLNRYLAMETQPVENVKFTGPRGGPVSSEKLRILRLQAGAKSERASEQVREAALL
jgi:hypothetical protein